MSIFLHLDLKAKILFKDEFCYNSDDKTCLKCGKFYTFECDSILWCNICSVKYVQENLCTWSENERIDNFIKEKQQKANGPKEFFEWIPCDRFKNLILIEKKEFVRVYSAIWIDGCLEFYNEEDNQLRRHEELMVILKELDNGKNISDDFLDEV